jgi:peptide deformylase
MAIKRILRYPDPELRRHTLPVQWTTGSVVLGWPSEGLSEVIGDLSDTLQSTDDGLAIAANQVIGGGPRLFVWHPQQTEFIRSFGTQVVINPTWEELSDRKDIDTEGCLSFPNLKLTLARYAEIQVDYQDIDGNRFSLPLDGLAARAVQHEVEHLDGKLFIDHLPRRKQFEIRALAIKNRKAGK